MTRKLMALMLALMLLGVTMAEEEMGFSLFGKEIKTHSLWGKHVTVALADYPADAFQGQEGRRVEAMSADGNVLFISDVGGAPYLWNLSDGRRIALYPADEESAGLLEMEYAFMCDKLGIEKADYDDLAGAKQLEAYGQVYMRSMGRGYSTQQQLAFDKYLLVVNYQSQSGQWLIDTQTGGFRVVSEGTAYSPAKDGKLLLTHIPNPGFEIDIATGEAAELVIPSAFLPINAQSASVLCYLPDGGICAAVNELHIQENRSRLCGVYINPVSGESEFYELGPIAMSYTPDTMFVSASGNRVLLFSKSFGEFPRILIDRTTGEIWDLGMNGIGYFMRTVPLEDCRDDDGSLERVDRTGQQVYLPLTQMVDGTLLVYNASYGSLFLLDLDTLQTQPLMMSGEADSIKPVLFSALHRITGNGYDRLCIGAGLDKQYVRMIVE